MKKVALIIPCIFLAFGTLQAQILPGDTSYYAPFEVEGAVRDDNANYYYTSLGLSYAMPRGNWAAAPSPDQPLLAPFVGEDGMGAGSGYTAYFTQVVGISANTVNAIYPTVHWSLEYSYNGSLEWSEVIEGSYNSYGSDMLSFAIGGGASYNYNNRWVLESSLSFYLPVIVGAPDISYLGGTGFTNVEDHFQVASDRTNFEGEENAFNLGYGLNVGLRIKHIKIFAELFWYNHEHYYEYETYYSNGGEIIEPFTSDFTVSTLRLGLGYIF